MRNEKKLEAELFSSLPSFHISFSPYNSVDNFEFPKKNMPKAKKKKAKTGPKPIGEKKRRRNVWTSVVFPFLLFTFVFGGLDAILLQDPWSFGIAVYLVAALNWNIFFRISGQLRRSLVAVALFLAGFAVVLFIVPPVRIAKETTFLTEPKTVDGTRINYEQAIQNRFPDAEVFALDPNYCTAESFFTRHKDEIPTESPIRLLNRLMENPWTETDSPLAKRWLDQHGLTPQGRDFRVRIQYELGSRNPDKAWDDVLTLFRLSQRSFQDVHETTGFFGAQALWNDALLSAVAVIQHGEFSVQQLQSKLAELEPFFQPFTKEIGKAILDTERLMILSRIQAIAWGEDSAPAFKRFFRFFHWNETLIRVNSYFDWIEILEAPSYSLASRFPIKESTSEWATILKTGMFRAASDKQGIHEIRIWDDKASVLEQQLRVLRAKSALLQAVFYLEMYGNEHGGKYPATLDELKSQYGDGIPDDPCSTVRSGDRSFKYESLQEGFGYKLYSVGPNGIDENGASWQEKRGSDDIVVLKY